MGGVGSGDKLARGSAKAQFPPAGGKKTQAEWDAMFEGFDPAVYDKHFEEEREAARVRVETAARKEQENVDNDPRWEHVREINRRYASASETGVSSPVAGETVPDAGE